MHPKLVPSIWCGTSTMPPYSNAAEPRNVRLGLCVDGFNPYSNAARPYAVWPIMICVYNLPPHLCMTRSYMFLASMIPGPNNPKIKIDVLLQSLIDELRTLWDEGVDTYDIHANQTFKMRVALMWTVNDFPAYGMLSGWSAHGHCLALFAKISCGGST